MKCHFYFLSYVDAILVVWRCIQRNFLMLTFMSKCFLKSLWQRETQLSIFWKIIAWTVKFSLKTSMFLGRHGFNILIHKYFSEEWEQIDQFSLKRKKKQKTIQMPNIFLKFYINQSSKQFLLLFHFPDLWILNSFTWRVVSTWFFNLDESGLNLLSSSI